MSTDNDDYIVKSCEPKSDQLNADDLISGPRIVTVTGVKRGDTQQPVWIELSEAKTYKPSKGMRRVLVAAWGQHPAEWIGKRMEVYRDNNVVFGGVRVGGIRISGLSGIKSDMTFLITTSKGKRHEVTVKRIDDKPKTETPPLTEAEKTYIEDYTAELSRATTLDELNTISAGLEKKTDSVKNIMRPVYKACAAKLKQPEEDSK